MIRRSALAAVLAAALLGHPTQPQEPLEVYLFAGQSNMLGADAIIDPSEVKDLADVGRQTAADRSSMLAVGGAESYPWGDIRGHDSVYRGVQEIAGRHVKGHGPEVGFNRALGGRIAIIKYADNFKATENGRSPWVKPGSRWRAWQAFVDARLATLGRPYVVAGFVWHQGIDDGLLHRERGSYQADLEQIAADLRAKFGNKPFVVARSVNSQLAGPAAMAPIRAAQEAVGSEPGNAWVTLDDLPLVNTHHLTAAAQLEAGQRFAKAVQALP